MKKSTKFSPEVRERAVRMVQEHRGEYQSLWAAIESIAPKIGCVAQTLLDWVKQSEVDGGARKGRIRFGSSLSHPWLDAGRPMSDLALLHQGPQGLPLFDGRHGQWDPLRP